MTIRISVAGEMGTAHGPFPFDFLQQILNLSGRKRWQGANACHFQATSGNVRLLQESKFDIQWIDRSGELKELEALRNAPTQHTKVALPKIRYKSKTTPMNHQERCLGLSWDRTAYGILFDMGLGKTKIAIDTAGMLFVKKKIVGMLVVAPSGVHSQWIEEEIPKHLDSRIKLKMWNWKENDYSAGELEPNALNVFAINIEATITERGWEAVQAFLDDCQGRVLSIYDESQRIKTWGAQVTRRAMEIGALSSHRRIITGTPIAKSLEDAFPQFHFLDRRILGHRYLTSFRREFCVMGGFQGRQVVGHRNVDRFYQMIAPHSFRMTKDEAIDLPTKNYVVRPYEMSAAVRKHYKRLQNEMLTQLSDGSEVTITHQLTMVLRLQQVVCGYLPREDGTIETISAERIEQLKEVIEQVSGQVVVWCRFTEDINRISRMLQDRFADDGHAVYNGATKSKKGAGSGDEAKKLFLTGKVRFLVGNSAAGGAGLNLQTRECQNVVYYSNSFRSLDRWQSEDRTHRRGMGESMTYHDLVCRGTVDRGILANLRGKRDLAKLSLDDIRKLIES